MTAITVDEATSCYSLPQRKDKTAYSVHGALHHGQHGPATGVAITRVRRTRHPSSCRRTQRWHHHLRQHQRCDHPSQHVTRPHYRTPPVARPQSRFVPSRNRATVCGRMTPYHRHGHVAVGALRWAQIADAQRPRHLDEVAVADAACPGHGHRWRSRCRGSSRVPHQACHDGRQTHGGSEVPPWCWDHPWTAH